MRYFDAAFHGNSCITVSVIWGVATAPSSISGHTSNGANVDNKGAKVALHSVLSHPRLQGVTLVASPVPSFFASHGMAVSRSCWLCQMCESAWAGSRKCRVYLFLLPCELGDPWSNTQAEAHKWGCRHCQAQSVLEDCWPSVYACFPRVCTGVVYHHAFIIIALWSSLY